MATATPRWSDPVYTDQPTDQIHEKSFDVVGTSDPIDARNAIGINRNDPYAPGSRSLCQYVEARANGHYGWIVTAHYAIPANGSWTTPNTDPLLQPAQTQWDPDDEDAPCDRDTKGCPIVNSNGDPFDPPGTRPIRKKLVRITRNMAFYDLANAKTYEDMVNSDSITFHEPNGNSVTFAPQFIRCVSLMPSAPYDLNATFVQMSGVFELYIINDGDSGGLATDHPHQLRFLNQGTTGFYQLSGSSVNYRGKFVDSQGRDLPGPVRLKQNGIPYDTTIKVDAGAYGLGAPVANGYTSASTTAIYTENADHTATFVTYLRYKTVAMAPLFSSLQGV